MSGVREMHILSLWRTTLYQSAWTILKPPATPCQRQFMREWAMKVGDVGGIKSVEGGECDTRVLLMLQGITTTHTMRK